MTSAEPAPRIPSSEEARIRAALARVAGFDAGDARLVVLRRRRDRVTVRADDGRARVVVRAARSGSSDPGGVERIAGAIEAAAGAGVAPRCLFADPGNGIVVTAWAPGAPWSDDDLADPDRLRRLAATLRGLHAVRADLPPFDIVGHVRAYRARSEQPASAGDAELREELFELDELASWHVTHRSTDALGHHDVTSGNVVGDLPMLIDWEYAARSDPAFDLATVLALHRVGAAGRELFLDAYENAAPGRRRIDRPSVTRCGRLVWLLARVWTRLACVDNPQDARAREWAARLDLPA